MFDIAYSVGAFIVAILVLVSVHEFGHFWAARRLGVKVLRFSIGFGRPLLTWHRRNDPTEYVVAALPLGGYVRMLDEHEDPVAPEERHLAFNNQRLWRRSLIVVAGPAANFLLALLLYWLVLMAGETGLRAEVGAVAPDSMAASAGFQVGDQLLLVGDQDAQTWGLAWVALMAGALDGKDLPVRVRAVDGSEQTRVLPGSELARLDPGSSFLQGIGLESASAPLAPRIGQVVAGEPADLAGLRTGDLVLTAGGEPVATWEAFVEIVQAHPERPLPVSVERDGGRLDLVLHPWPRDVGDQVQGRIGAGVAATDDAPNPYLVRITYGPVDAFTEASRRVVEVSVLTLRIIGRMIVGTASVENISSPIGIADTAGRTAAVGLESFVKFLAVLSVSLGLLNLLPIPILDGGHLLYFAIEGLTGRPLSETLQAQGQRIGLALLLSLMALAFYVDIARLLG